MSTVKGTSGSSDFFGSKVPIFLDIETDWVPDGQLRAWGPRAISEIKCWAMTAGEPGEETLFSGISGVLFLDKLGYFIDKYGQDNIAIVGHNIFRFDAPVISIHLGTDLLNAFEIFDTLLMSKISEYDRSAHSLECYAEQFDIQKVSMETPEERESLPRLVHRCGNDVLLTQKLFFYLLGRKKELEIPDNPYKVEFRVAEIIARQVKHGVRFDSPAALKLEDAIKTEMQSIRDSIDIEIEVPEKDLVKPPKVQFRKDGSISSAMRNYAERLGGSVNEICRTMYLDGRIYPLPILAPIPSTRQLTIDSSSELKAYLLSKGWLPTMYNIRKMPDGSSKVTSPKLYDENKELCPNLAAMDIPGVSLISRLLTLKNRLGVLQGWITNPRQDWTNRLSSDADTIGAVTHRFTHKIVANVPRSTSPLGKEFRSLFIPSEGKRMVGWDASALEAVMEAHYTYPYDPAYAQELIRGDIHTKNQILLGLPDRNKAKTWKYAVTYGAMAKKLASTFGWSVKEAQERLHVFWAGNPALARLKEEVQKAAAARGFIRSIDGRPIATDSPHSALNRLLQSAGAITMKYAMVLADRRIRKQNLDAHGLIRYHDEEQWEAAPECAEEVGRIGVDSIEAAARYLKLRVPLTGTTKSGYNWSETH